MIDKAKTGKRIASLRRKLGYSQAAFAEKLNVTPQAVSKWETGATLPDVDILLSISWMCRVTINEILDSEEVFIDQLNSVERELIRMNKFLTCPECRKSLTLRVQTSGAAQYFECDNHHRFSVEDGVVFFNSREMQGELWSLYLRNYEHYLQEATYIWPSRHAEGELSCREVLWLEIEKRRPATIVDIASGTGIGIKYGLQRINWPCTVILTDLSFRILAWDRKYMLEEMRNPYVDLVFLACDSSNIPLRDGSVDMVFSYSGFESMKDKMIPGFNEAHRILKPNGSVVYSMLLVDDHQSTNTKKWIELCLTLPTSYGMDASSMRDCRQWLEECKKTGFARNDVYAIYPEMPAPDVEACPFENQIARWKACYAFVSEK